MIYIQLEHVRHIIQKLRHHTPQKNSSPSVRATAQVAAVKQMSSQFETLVDSVQNCREAAKNARVCEEDLRPILEKLDTMVRVPSEINALPVLLVDKLLRTDEQVQAQSVG